MNPDYDIKLFQTGKECLEKLYLKPDIICLDFGLPDISGDMLLKKILQVNNTIAVIMISGQEDIEVAVNCLKAGAKDYLVKNNNTSPRTFTNSSIKT